MGGLTNGVDGSVAVDMPSAEDEDACRCEAGAVKPATDDRVAASEIRVESFIIGLICSSSLHFVEQLLLLNYDIIDYCSGIQCIRQTSSSSREGSIW